MPQSWPSAWNLLFILFILSFLIVLLLIYFFSESKVFNSASLYKSNNLSWEW